MTAGPDFQAVRDHLAGLQDSICRGLEEIDGGHFEEQQFEGTGDSVQRPRVLSDGAVIEKAAVHFSSTAGKELPAAATERKPELAGREYRAASVSLIIHPRNPMAPTSHANFRFFEAGDAWWFGGGFDLTPYYGFAEDCERWHRAARDACGERHASFKKACDEYFLLPHRGEPRGIGGVFYDDLDQPDFASCFNLHRAVSSAYIEAYAPILRERSQMEYGERERQWQLLRRGRYVEFNLLQDRGTRFGLEAGGRVESILASLPPLVRWEYDHQPEPGSPEARLLEEFLIPRDWLDPR